MEIAFSQGAQKYECVRVSTPGLHLSTNPKNPEFRHEVATDLGPYPQMGMGGWRECRTDAEAERRRWVVTTAGTISALLGVGVAMQQRPPLILIRKSGTLIRSHRV